MTRDSVVRALRTAVQTFVAVFGVQLIGVLNDVVEWSATADNKFPSFSPLTKAAISAAAAAATGLVTFVQNWAEDRRGVSKGLFGAVKPDAGKI